MLFVFPHFKMAAVLLAKCDVGSGHENQSYIGMLEYYLKF